MRPSLSLAPFGGENKVVEVDETYIGGKEANKSRSRDARPDAQGGRGKEIAVALVERDGSVCSMHMPAVDLNKTPLRPALRARISTRSHT